MKKVKNPTQRVKPLKAKSRAKPAATARVATTQMAAIIARLRRDLGVLRAARPAPTAPAATLAAPADTLFSPIPPSGPQYTHPGEFTDDRGTILRLTDKSVGSVQLITTRAGCARAGHYHKQDGHLCTVVSGHIVYYERPVGSTEPPGCMTFTAGQSFFTGPGVEHSMFFPEATVFICMANKHRTPQEYEADLVRLDKPLFSNPPVDKPESRTPAVLENTVLALGEVDPMAAQP